MVKVKVGRRRLQGQGQGAGDRSELGGVEKYKGASRCLGGCQWNEVELEMCHDKKKSDK